MVDIRVAHTLLLTNKTVINLYVYIIYTHDFIVPLMTHIENEVPATLDLQLIYQHKTRN